MAIDIKTSRAVTDSEQIDFTLAAEDFFLMPGADPGLSFWQNTPDWYWRPRPRAKIIGVSLSRYDDINEKIDVQIRRTRRMRDFDMAIEFNTLPVVLQDAQFVKSFVSAKGKYLLHGATGTRMRNNYKWKHVEVDPDTDEHLHDWHDACQARAKDHPLPITNEDIRDMDFAIEARNTFNYYHFVTETLPQLCALDGLGHRGRIFIHYPNSSPSGFVMGFVKALFPELADRVTLERSPKSYTRVLTAFNLRHYYYQTSDDIIPSVDSHAPAGWIWQGRKASRASQAILWQNSIDTNLLRLRQRGLNAVKDRDNSHLPRRFWVGRSSEGARVRSMKGEAALVAALKSHGFAQVEFETLEPLDQIAVMANAEMMISYHGAGFTNMLFAHPQAHVVELGTLQTAMYRWADFQPHAHVAGCCYTSFFADHNTATPQELPNFATDSIVPVDLAGERMNLVVGFVTAVLALPSPKLTPDEISKLTGILQDADMPEAASRILQKHPSTLDKDIELLKSSADILIKSGDLLPAIEALGQAYDLDNGRYRLLQRMVHLARKAKADEKIPVLLDELKNRFPDRHAAFVETLGWHVPSE